MERNRIAVRRCTVTLYLWTSKNRQLNTNHHSVENVVDFFDFLF